MMQPMAHMSTLESYALCRSLPWQTSSGDMYERVPSRSNMSSSPGRTCEEKVEVGVSQKYEGGEK